VGRGPGSSARAGSASSGFSVVDPSPDAASAAGSSVFGGSSGEGSIGRRRWRFYFRRRGIRSGGWWLRRCERHVDLVDLEPDLAADPVEEALLLEREVDERLLALAHELARVEADAAEEVVPQAGGGAT